MKQRVLPARHWILSSMVALTALACSEPQCAEGELKLGAVCRELSRIEDSGTNGTIDAEAEPETAEVELQDAAGEHVVEASVAEDVMDASRALDAPNADASNASPTCVPQTELCNGKDDDCDGEIDEGAAEPPLGETCSNGGQGVCAGAGQRVCFDGMIKCSAPMPVPQAEVCDGADNDCDGVVDNVPGKGSACSAGAGECTAAGVMECAHAGALVCNAVPKPKSPETCDSKDNDCDGISDNNVPVTACSAGQGECRRDGVVLCSNGTTQCSVVPALPAAEVCDGRDNDCDGLVDNLNQACGNGLLGVCYRAGQLRCTGGGPACDAPPGTPTACTLADNLDNDCDGLIDEASGQPDVFNGGFLQKC